MGVLNKADIPRPTRRSETFEVTELGGEIIVRQMTLQLYNESLIYAARHNGAAPMATLLAACVVDVNYVPIMDEDEWEAWGALNSAAAYRLYQKIRDLSGLDLEAAAKN